MTTQCADAPPVGSEEAVDNDDCAICFSAMDRQTAYATECKHTFHVKCLQLWVNRAPTCPLCRANLAGQVDRLRKAFVAASPSSNVDEKISLETFLRMPGVRVLHHNRLVALDLGCDGWIEALRHLLLLVRFNWLLRAAPLAATSSSSGLDGGHVEAAEFTLGDGMRVVFEMPSVAFVQGRDLETRDSTPRLHVPLVGDDDLFAERLARLDKILEGHARQVFSHRSFEYRSLIRTPPLLDRPAGGQRRGFVKLNINDRCTRIFVQNRMVADNTKLADLIGKHGRGTARFMLRPRLMAVAVNPTVLLSLTVVQMDIVSTPAADDRRSRFLFD